MNTTNKMPRLSVGTINLSPDEIAWLTAACNLSGVSVRAQIGQTVQGHIIRFKPHYKRKIAYVARMHGISFEEAFARLQAESPPFKDLPIVDEAPVIEEEEISDFGCELLDKEEKNDSTNKTTTK